ncbi:MAG: hypothetical protein ACJ74N_12550 [Gaiellaceae bacterium]|jgi:hypothetical protein
MRRLAFVIVVLALTAGAAGASTVTSGLRGTVYSMGGGACLEGGNCGKRPLAHTTLVFSVAGRPIARTVTHADGSYRIHLAAGTYDVRTGQAARRVAPTRASVVKGKMTTQQFVVAGPRIP